MRSRNASARGSVFGAIVVVLVLFTFGFLLIRSAQPVTASGEETRAVGAATWASGWVTILPGSTQVFNHNLGLAPERYAVDLLFRDDNDGWGVNRRNYGGLEANGKTFGAYWSQLTTNSITIHRAVDDNSADSIRVQVWVMPTPDYDSDWRLIAPGQTIDVHHGLNADRDDLTVGLWFKNNILGINQAAFGGLETGANQLLGAYWFGLDENSVQVQRLLNDTYAEHVRVVIVKGAPRAYDSLVSLGGWQGLAAGSIFTFTHGLNWPPEMLLVRGECREPLAMGINQLYAGGVYGGTGWRGAHFQNLASNTVQFVRRLNDITCPEARVVISLRGSWNYLPSVQNN